MAPARRVPHGAHAACGTRCPMAPGAAKGPECKKFKGTPKPDCIEIGTVTSCTCGGIVCRGDSVTETYSCA